MPKGKILLIAVAFFTQNIIAQTLPTDSLKHKYNNLTVYRYGNSFMKGGDLISFKELGREFTMSDLGLTAYQKAVRYKKTSSILSLLSIGFAAGTIATIGSSSNNKTTTALFIGQLAFSLSSLKFRHLSNKYLDRAIWQRNKDLLFPPVQ